ncbi:glycosyltransferase [Rhodococcus sp. USK10]|uniref:glycosyltransferase n=1 Tax=Rhodococcus sp. USK10 TaxID=2789739 RepID=UPI0021510EC1|nr:glycosyltransferase [Rhodococcus sp. USK10]
MIALSHAMKDRIELNEPGKYEIRVKYNCLEEEPTRNSAEKSGLIWVGRLEPEKGFHHFLSGWEKSHRPPLTIVGSGSLRAEAEDLLKRYPGLVQFCAEISHGEAMRLIAKSRLSVVIPLWEEPFGRVVLESLAMGTPVLHSGRGALTELIGDGGWQIASTAQAVARGIDEHYSIAESKRDSARRRYDDILSPEATTLRLQEIYNEAIGANRKSD